MYNFRKVRKGRTHSKADVPRRSGGNTNKTWILCRAEAPGKRQEFYEPAWIFYTKDEAGDVMRLCVNAVA